VEPAQTCDVNDNKDETSKNRNLEILLPATEGGSKSLRFLVTKERIEA
jgi:hypothetical protein